jgi:hypothetical protein
MLTLSVRLAELSPFSTLQKHHVTEFSFENKMYTYCVLTTYPPQFLDKQRHVYRVKCFL